jgi:hypothetical protein
MGKIGRKAKELIVTAVDRAQLESIARSQSLPAALARRAQMILQMADGETNSAVARRYRVSRPTVTMWRTRFRERGMAGLHNELKPGRPRSTSEERRIGAGCRDRAGRGRDFDPQPGEQNYHPGVLSCWSRCWRPSGLLLVRHNRGYCTSRCLRKTRSTLAEPPPSAWPTASQQRVGSTPR